MFHKFVGHLSQGRAVLILQTLQLSHTASQHHHSSPSFNACMHHSLSVSLSLSIYVCVCLSVCLLPLCQEKICHYYTQYVPIGCY